MTGPVLVLLALAVLLAVAAIRTRKLSKTGSLGGTVVYADTEERLERVLVSHRYRLAGKPDHLVRTGNGVVPVERKSKRWRGKEPRDGDRAQLLAYCLLVEDAMGERVPHGRLLYADSQFTVPFGAAERTEIVALLAEMERERAASHVGRSHTHTGKCRACGVRSSCGEALVS